MDTKKLKIDSQKLFDRSRNIINIIKAELKEASDLSKSTKLDDIIETLHKEDDYEGVLELNDVSLKTFTKALSLYKGDLFDGEYAIEDEWGSVHYIKMGELIFRISSNSHYFLRSSDEDYEMHLDRMDKIRTIKNVTFALQTLSKDNDFFQSLTEFEQIHLITELKGLKLKRLYTDKNILFIADDDYESFSDSTEATYARLNAWKTIITNYLNKKEA